MHNSWSAPIVFACLCAGVLAYPPALPAAASDPDPLGAVEVAVETPDARADWRSDAEDAPALRRVVDAPTGRVCLEYDEQTPLKHRSYATEIDREAVAGADTLALAYKVVDAPARVFVAVHGYPEPGDQRRYYLHKRPQPRGRWQQVWLDLGHDDDGDWFEAAEDLEPGKVRVQVQVSLWDIGEAGAEPRVVVRLADIKLTRHPLRVHADLHDVTMIEDGQRVGSEYALTVTNRAAERRTARLLIDDAQLDAFSVELDRRELALDPGQSQQVTARITAPADRAAQLPPLYTERAPIFATTADAPDDVTPWYHGYLVYSLTGAVPPPGVERPAPWLLTDAQRQRALERASAHPRAARIVERIIKDAEQMLEMSPVPPGEDTLHGNPNQMVHKQFKSTMRFHAPGRVWLDKQQRYLTEAELAELPESRRLALGYAHHSMLSHGTKTLAQAWWLTGRRAFAQHAKRILLGYAQRYPDWPRHQPRSAGFAAKVGSGTLQESWWFRPLPLALDLVRGAGVLSAQEDRQIVEGLLLPVAVTIRQHRIEANQQAESNAAIGLGALMAGRWDLVADTISSDGGLRAQWRNDFDADGYSSERDLGYHFAALAPFVELAAAYEAVGIPMFDPEFKRLFDAPVARAPDQVAGGPAGLYAHAYAHYHDPAYLPQLRRDFARWSFDSLITPVDPDAVAASSAGASLTNSVLESSGYTVLRGGSAQAPVAVAVNWGSPSKRNGHAVFDFQALWHGRALNRQTDRIGYGYRQSPFAYEPIASNTVVVDGARHSMLRATPVAMLEGELPAARWLSPRTSPLYDGVAWARSAAVVGPTVLVIDQLQSESPRRFDWVTYPGNTFNRVDLGGEKVAWSAYPELLEQGRGYRFLDNPRVAERDAGAVVTAGFRLKQKAAGRLDAIGSGSQLLSAEGWRTWHPKPAPLLIQRATEATDAWFVGAYTGMDAGDDATVQLQRVPVSAEQGGQAVAAHDALAVEVRHAAGRFLVLTANDDRAYHVADQTLRGPLAVVRLGTP